MQEYKYDGNLTWKNIFFNDVAKPVENGINAVVIVNKFCIFWARCANFWLTVEIVFKKIDYVKQEELNKAKRLGQVWKYNIRWNDNSETDNLNVSL